VPTLVAMSQVSSWVRKVRGVLMGFTPPYKVRLVINQLRRAPRAAAWW
jgi:hypothetical protein